MRLRSACKLCMYAVRTVISTPVTRAWLSKSTPRESFWSNSWISGSVDPGAGTGSSVDAGVVVCSGDIAGVSMIARDAAGVVCKVSAAASGDAGASAGVSVDGKVGVEEGDDAGAGTGGDAGVSIGVTSGTFRNGFLFDRLTVGGGSTMSSVVKSTISGAGA